MPGNILGPARQVEPKVWRVDRCWPRLGSSRAPQIEQPAADRLTCSRQFGHCSGSSCSHRSTHHKVGAKTRLRLIQDLSCCSITALTPPPGITFSKFWLSVGSDTHAIPDRNP